MLRRALFALLAVWALLGLGLSGAARAAHAPAAVAPADDVVAAVAVAAVTLADSHGAPQAPSPVDAPDGASVTDNLPAHELPEALVAGLAGSGSPRPGIAPVGPPAGPCPCGAPEHLLRPPSASAQP